MTTDVLAEYARLERERDDALAENKGLCELREENERLREENESLKRALWERAKKACDESP